MPAQPEFYLYPFSIRLSIPRPLLPLRGLMSTSDASCLATLMSHVVCLRVFRTEHNQASIMSIKVLPS